MDMVKAMSDNAQQSLFDLPPEMREPETADKRAARIHAENVYSAQLYARCYVGTLEAAWLAYFEGEADRPLLWGTPFTGRFPC